MNAFWSVFFSASGAAASRLKFSSGNLESTLTMRSEVRITASTTSPVRNRYCISKWVAGRTCFNRSSSRNSPSPPLSFGAFRSSSSFETFCPSSLISSVAFPSSPRFFWTSPITFAALSRRLPDRVGLRLDLLVHHRQLLLDEPDTLLRLSLRSVLSESTCCCIIRNADSSFP